jgi:ribonuclease D
VAAGDRLAIVDPLQIDDLNPFWRLLTTPGHVSIVHAGREEFRFCRRAIGQRPAEWFDTQIASGLIGLDYPAAYGTLIQKLLAQSLRKGETRTNWRRRPLSKRQLEYALQDVIHLDPLYHHIVAQLEEMGRRAWLDDELQAWQDQLEKEEVTQRWRRVSGISGLSRRQLAVLYELWQWRDEKAKLRDVPPRRVLRDDLMVELARRASADERRIRALRGMDWRRQQRAIPEIAQCIGRGLAIPDEDCPHSGRRSPRPQFNLLGQFLATAVNSMARSARVAPGLVGSVQDVRDLIAYHLGYSGEDVPTLAQGWRSEVVGQVVDKLLDGDLAIRIADPNSNQPLSFEPIQETG